MYVGDLYGEAMLNMAIRLFASLSKIARTFRRLVFNRARQAERFCSFQQVLLDETLRWRTTAALFSVCGW